MLAAAKADRVARLTHNVSTEAVLADGKPIVQADETRPRTTRPIGPYPLSKGSPRISCWPRTAVASRP